MQYLGGKNRIKKQISEVINNAILGWQNKDSETDSRDNKQIFGGGGASYPFSVEVV